MKLGCTGARPAQLLEVDEHAGMALGRGRVEAVVRAEYEVDRAWRSRFWRS